MYDLCDVSDNHHKCFRRQRHFFTAVAISRRAEQYLGKFSASEQMLQEVLHRQIQRYERLLRAAAGQQNKPDWLMDIPDKSHVQAMLAAEITRCRTLGYVDDHRFARGRILTLYHRGTPLQQIRLKLRQKGISGSTVDSACADLYQEVAKNLAPSFNEADQVSLNLTQTDIDLKAASHYAQRRRLGRYRQGICAHKSRQEQDQKDLLALCRAGFSWDIAKQVI